MKVHAGAVSVNICATSTSEVSVGFRDNIAARKIGDHTKRRLGSLIPKFIRYFTCKVVGRNSRARKLSWPRQLDKENQNVMRKEKANTDFELFLTFYPVVLTCASSQGLFPPQRVCVPITEFTLSCPSAK